MKRLLLVLLLMTNFAFASEQSDLEGYVKKWAPKMHMEAWTITVKAVPAPILTSYTHNFIFGVSHWDPYHRTGLIAVASRDSYSKYMLNVEGIKKIKLDQENTVIHEILHNVWAHMTNEEAAVQLLSELVVPEHNPTIMDKLLKRKPKGFKEPDVSIMDQITHLYSEEAEPTVFNLDPDAQATPVPPATPPAGPEN